MRAKNRIQNCLLKEDMRWINRKDHVDEWVRGTSVFQAQFDLDL